MVGRILLVVVWNCECNWRGDVLQGGKGGGGRGKVGSELQQ